MIYNYARIAWKAYAETVGGTTFDNKPLPSFDDLGERQKVGWKAAAQAVIDTNHAAIDAEEEDEEGVDAANH